MSDVAYLRWCVAKALEELADGVSTGEHAMAAIEALLDAKIALYDRTGLIRMPPDSGSSAVQPERCCLDYPRCDCNSPPEPAQEPKGCNHFPGQVNCEWCTEVPHE